MKYESPSSSESCTRRLVCRSHGGSDNRVGRDDAAGLGEDDVEADRAQEGALAGHVRSGDQQQRARRADADVIADPPVVGQQRMPERGASMTGASESTGRLQRRVVGADAGQHGHRVELRERLDPARTCGPTCDAPPLEREDDVEVPQRQRLNRKVQDAGRMPQLAKAEDAMQPAHAPRAPAGLLQSAAVKRARVAAPLGGARTACSSSAPYRPSALLAGAGAIQPAATRAGQNERQHDADSGRHQPEARRRSRRRAKSANRIQIAAVNASTAARHQPRRDVRGTAPPSAHARKRSTSSERARDAAIPWAAKCSRHSVSGASAATAS